MRKAMLGLFLVVPLAWAGAVFSAEAPPARQQGIGGTVKVQANSVMRLPKRAQELRLRRVEIGEDAALLIPLEVSVLRIEELHMAKNARIGVAPGEDESASKSSAAAWPMAASFPRPARPAPSGKAPVTAAT